MADTTLVSATPPGPSDASPRTGAEPGDDTLVVEELLVEEISIDGMCGVY